MSTATERLMERVRALLTQAEHPNTSQAEAEVFTAKAAALMAKYGIDQAMLGDRAETRETVASVRVQVDQPYSREKATLFSYIAQAMQCQVVMHSWGRTVEAVTAYGFAADLERAQVLYTSLLLQATRDVMRTQVQTAAYRRTWLVGFATAVSGRLRAAERAAQDDAEQRRRTGNDGSRSVALVLADRSSMVSAARAEAHPGLKKGRKRQLSGGGLRDGYAAGKRADIGSTRVASASRRGIGGAR